MKILLKGPFTNEDIAVLAETVRAIERRQPHEEFRMMIADEGKTAEEAEAMLQQVFPFVEGAPVEVKVWRKGETNG
jgi:hypothetical protein